MHEFSICRALIAQVETIASTRAARSVERIRVTIGPLSGVVPELLSSAFELAKAGTIAAGATLVLDPAPLVTSCAACGAQSRADLTNMCCRACGNWQTTVVSGDDLTLREIELLPT